MGVVFHQLIAQTPGWGFREVLFTFGRMKQAIGQLSGKRIAKTSVTVKPDKL